MRLFVHVQLPVCYSSVVKIVDMFIAYLFGAGKIARRCAVKTKLKNKAIEMH